MSESRPMNWPADDDGSAAGGATSRPAPPPASGPLMRQRLDPTDLPAQSARPASPATSSPSDGPVDDSADDDADDPPDEPPSPTRWGPTWTANQGLERLLTTAMFACLAWSLAQAMEAAGVRLSRGISLFLLTTAVFAIGVAIGGHPNGRNYRKYTDYGIADWLLLLVPILLFVRLLPSLLDGPAALSRDIGGWIDDPIRFWDAGLAWSIILLFFVWDISLSVAESLGLLAFQPGERSPAASGASPSSRAAPSGVMDEWLSMPYRFVDHAGAWRRLMRFFITGGCVLLLLTGLSVVSPEDIGNANRPEVAGVMPIVLLYFLLGLVLASQTSLDRLRAGWLRGGVDIQPGLARRWLGYSLALVGLGLLLALLLPTSFSEQAADRLPLFWRWLWFVRLPFAFVLRLLEWLIGGLAALLFVPFSLLFPRGQEGGPSALPPPPIATPFPIQPDTSTFPSVASRIAWGVVLYLIPAALAAYAIWNTWRKRRAIWRELRAFWGGAWQLVRDALLDLAAALWRFLSFGSPRILGLAPRALQERLRRRRRAGQDVAGGARPWLRLGGLGPRELIQYFYVSLVQRAASVGWDREKGQTPYEFSADLAERIPERREELRALTDAFVRAKYSAAPVSDADARQARGPWQRLRDALQVQRRAGQLTSWLFGR